ncbi:MAG TPA: VIT1/CCC1 transporter family protein [Gemmatimonadaceae bacterium]|nr:VIT1/CCC1 transporter family protein [Gemmatimonadaceae bacterium]
MAAPVTSPERPPDLDAFAHHWQDEADAAFLYRVLAGAETDPKRKEIYGRLAEVEDRHVEIWAGLLRRQGREPKPFHPTGRTRLLAWLGRLFGPGFLLPMLLREEGREVMGYLDLHRSMKDGAPGSSESLTLARESAEHASTLSSISGNSGEPWHQTKSGGFLRNVVYGFNDGLTANFGLVAGVLGATADVQHHTVIVAGVAGLIADALSMGSSGYLAAKSEQEVYAKEIATERDEIALMPELERDELAIIYEAKGMTRPAAHQRATEVMADPDRMLAEKVQEELKIGDPHMSPLREGWVTGSATAIGALIPVFPFFIWSGNTAILVALGVAMLSHWLIGAARSVFTGRGAFRSGTDMFVVGLGVAIAGFFVGEWVSRALA